MNAVLFVGAIIFGLMAAEARVSRRHERILMARGAERPAGDVYLLLAVLYPLAFLAMTVEGIARAWEAAGSSSPVGPAWWLSGALLFIASKSLKYWAIGALGDRWSFKVIVEPGRPLVDDGPYRYIAHPNYVAIVGELVGAAIMVGARVTGPVMLVAFGSVLWTRIRFESRVLSSMRRRS